MGAHVPAIPAGPAVVMEMILTFFLMFVILGVSGFLNAAQGAANINRQPSSGLAVGAVVALAIWFAGPTSGASMNPIRSFAVTGAVRRRTAPLPLDLPHRSGRRRAARRRGGPPHPQRQPLPDLTRAPAHAAAAGLRARAALRLRLAGSISMSIDFAGIGVNHKRVSAGSGPDRDEQFQHTRPADHQHHWLQPNHGRLGNDPLTPSTTTTSAPRPTASPTTCPPTAASWSSAPPTTPPTSP